MDYTKTSLWENTLGLTDQENLKEISVLRDSFESARKNASLLLGKIRNDFPNLTVHDISHVDDLWQVASVIIGKNYDVNPLEGFVLGCAFLMHDAVLSYDAAGGKDNLRNTITWKDYYTDYSHDDALTPDQRLFETDFKTIRFLHAQYAKKLYSVLFTREDQSRFYIIEDETLRKHLGELICSIAASHHWSIEDIEHLGVQYPAPHGFPVEWRINPLKLACILRCADAGHIDAGRAPDYLLKLLTTNGVSRNHWVSQNRLSQIDIDIENPHHVIIKSNIKFEEPEFAAWNVAYDAVCVLDRELKASNEVLSKHNIEQFQAKAVSGADSRKSLSRYIETEGWIPCDAVIHISNVEELIKNLGGERLYGTENKFEIVLRELIQNARDAIVAREKIEPGFEGKIDISIEEDQDKKWVSVIDNGVGMSMNTINEYLLNFGSSFWASDLSKIEYPGLSSSGYKSVGRFGIGFYAVFMVASEVIIQTRRYDKALEDALTVKFPSGLSLHPIISNSKAPKTSISTIVRFCIDPHKYQWNKTKTINPHFAGESAFDVPYHAVLSNLTAGLDVDVYYSELGSAPINVHPSIKKLEVMTPKIAEWLKSITYAEYRLDSVFSRYIENNYQRVREIVCDGHCFGLAAINTLWHSGSSFFGISTVGGLSDFSYSSTGDDFIGVVFAEPNTARRDGKIQNITKSIWAKEQYEILRSKGLSFEDRLFLPYLLGKYEIDLTEDMLIRYYDNQTNITSASLKETLFHLKSNKVKLVLPLTNWSAQPRIENYLDYERSTKLLTEDEILFIVELNSSFLNIDTSDGSFPNTLIQCINHLAAKNSLQITYRTEDHKAISRLSGVCKGYVISVS